MKINEADIVIADLTDRNPNVFYELAIAHALSKPVIHMSKKGERIPFDVNQYRYVSYDDTDLAELEPTQQELESQLKNIPQNPEEIINPFTEALSMIRISKSGNPTEKIIAELRSTVGMQEARINQLESNQETRHYDELAQRERILESRENLEREIVRTGVELKHLSNKVNKDPDDLKRELYLKNKMEKLQISRTELMYRIHNRDD
ncbi:MAG: hypothetical protein M0Z77_10320 [Thermoplasmatales archaeon]|nr:hypothetical protein [Thermoplasmatales archaeon]